MDLFTFITFLYNSDVMLIAPTKEWPILQTCIIKMSFPPLYLKELANV